MTSIAVGARRQPIMQIDESDQGAEIGRPGRGQRDDRGDGQGGQPADHESAVGVVEADVQRQGEDHREQHAVLDRVDRGAGRAGNPPRVVRPYAGALDSPGMRQLVDPELTGRDLEQIRAAAIRPPQTANRQMSVSSRLRSWIAVMGQQQCARPGSQRQERDIGRAHLVGTHRRDMAST